MTTLPTSGSAPLTSTVIIVPTDQGVVFTATNAPPSGTYYPAGSVQHLFLTMVQDTQYQNNYNPVIATDFGIWAEKDVEAYGPLMTTAGAIKIGHGLEGTVDPPRILLTDNGYPSLYLRYQGGWGDMRLGTAVTDAVIVNGRTSDPSSPANGEIWFRSDLAQ